MLMSRRKLNYDLRNFGVEFMGVNVKLTSLFSKSIGMRKMNQLDLISDWDFSNCLENF